MAALVEDINQLYQEGFEAIGLKKLLDIGDFLFYLLEKRFPNTFSFIWEPQ